jgi:hypothetical protein
LSLWKTSKTIKHSKRMSSRSTTPGLPWSRLASLLWRMRRATAIETALLQIQVQIQAEILSDRRYEYETGDDIGNHVRTMLASARPIANR